MSATALEIRAESVREGLVHQLEMLLGDEDDAVRFHAAACAGALRLNELVPELIHGLTDPDEDVRAACVGALADIRSPESESALLRALREDPAPDCKLAAIQALSKMASSSTISLLRTLVRGRGEDIAWSEHWEEGWDDWLDIQIAAIRVLQRLGAEAAVADIEDALNDVEAQDLSGIACEAFSQLGEPGGAALDRCLQNGSPRLRREAIAALVKSPRRENIDRLRRLIQHQDASVRAAAARALALIDPADEALVPMLRDRDAQVVVTVVNACGHAHPRALFALSKDSRAKVREATAHAIERMALDSGHVEASLVTRVLPQLLADLEPEVVIAAIAAAAAARRDGALPLLIRFLEDPGGHSETTAAAAKALGELSGSAACPPLERAARSRLWQVRLAALAALARIAARGGPGAELAVTSLGDVIEEALDAESTTEKAVHDTGRMAAHPAAETGREIPVAVASPGNTLEEIMAARPPKSGDTGEPLQPEDAVRLENSALPRRRKSVPLGDDISSPRDAARLSVRALGQLPLARSVELIEPALRSTDEVLLVTALDALRRLKRQHGVDVGLVRNRTIELAGDEREPVRVQAAMLAAELGESSGLSDCLGLLKQGSMNAKRSVLEALGQDTLDADAAILDAVEPLLHESELQPLALTALARARPDGVSAHLVELLASGDEALQHSVHRILKSGVVDNDTALSVFSRALEEPGRARARPWLLEALTALGS